MRLTKHSLKTMIAAMVIGLIGFALAQDPVYGDDYNFDQVRPYGQVTSMTDAYDSTDLGSIILTQTTPEDQHANFDIVGPNGYYKHFDFDDDAGAEYVLDELTPGVYSIAATDEGLGLSQTTVRVTAGQVNRVSFDLEPWDNAYQANAFDSRSYWGNYDGYTNAYPGYPYGGYTVNDYEAYNTDTMGALSISGLTDNQELVITGPDGYSQTYSNDTMVEDLEPGVYALAVKGENTEVSVTTVEIQAAQQLPVTISFSAPMM
ncbi:MAG: carboxypeptidase regulatory-like domain-containing protein [Trueperaceae bacterium]|nr:carboxypeptidase regulatory-like domain-containing protein [Trueperaceae bacterium]